MEFDVEEFIKNHGNSLGKMDQKKFLDLMKINFQFLYEGFKTDDMFFYEIPMPLEIIIENKNIAKKRVHQTKFLVKKRSSSVGSIHSRTPVKLLKIQHEKPK